MKDQMKDTATIARYACTIAGRAAVRHAAEVDRIAAEAQQITADIEAAKPALPTLRFIVIVSDVRAQAPITRQRPEALVAAMAHRSFVVDTAGTIWNVVDFDSDIARGVDDYPNRTVCTAADVATIVGPGAAAAVTKAILSALRRVL